MESGTSLCLIVYFLVCSSEAQTNIGAENIKAELGQDVILPCKVPNNINIRAVQWSRPEMDPDYVLFYRDGHFHPDNQHPSYQNRVDLQDKEMKDGNFSLVLKNVTENDTGRYECRVFEEGKIELISIITLVVHLPVQKIIRPEIISAEVGQDVILPCKVPNNINIRAVEWIRSDQDPDHVLLYRYGYLHPENQHPSYQNRVDLQDKDMKDGNFSMILKNVMKNDTGRYEWRVFEEGKNEPINIIILVVHLPDDFCKVQSSKKSLIIGLAVGLAAAFILLIVAVVLFVHTRRQNRKRKTSGNGEQERCELLERNISKTTDELQNKEENNKKAESEIEKLQNRLQEFMKTKKDLLDEKLKLMETERKLKNKIQNQIQELDEMNFDSNSDSTWSNEKNQQEELEKQKWMKTVGNLKTELQNINQELKLTGSITVEEVHQYGRCIHLKNISSEEINLEGWELKLQINDSKPVTYRFNESVKLQAGRILTMGYISRLKHPEDVKLDWPDMKWNPEDKLRLKLISNNKQTFKLL